MFPKKNLSVMLILLFLVFGLGLGISVAYFTTRMQGNDEASSVTLTTAEVELSFTDGAAVNLTSLDPGDTTTKTFIVTNDNQYAYNYSVVWASIQSGFSDRQKLTYAVTCVGYTDYDNKTVSPTTCSGLNNAYSPASSSTQVGIISNNSIPSKETQEYTVTFAVASDLDSIEIVSFGGSFGIVGGSVSVNHSFVP